eukprot:4233046-Amphidinium_carterae.1
MSVENQPMPCKDPVLYKMVSYGVVRTRYPVTLISNLQLAIAATNKQRTIAYSLSATWLLETYVQLLHRDYSKMPRCRIPAVPST